MKFSKLACLSAAGMLSLVSTQAIFAQGMIINEFSNGASGNREYIELLVIGSTAAPTANVNLSGWVIDDNNGDFGSGSGKGIATGHMRIKSGFLNSVPVGSIILVYNSTEKETSIALADDPTDSNNDNVYIIPHTHGTFEFCTTTPTSSNASYTGCSYAAPTSTSWTSFISFANGGDAVQVRKPNFSFYHGFGYNTLTVVPTFPAELGGSSSFIAATTGTGSSVRLACGSYASGSNYTGSTSASVYTPGAANDATNSILIQNLRNGTFNYSNLSDPNNCLLVLPIELISFTARRNDLINQLTYTFTQVEPFSYIDIERSEDGISFEHLYTQPIEAKVGNQTLSFIDENPLQTSYYRLKMVDETGKISYSPVRVVMNEDFVNSIRLYPNPVTEELNIAFGEPLANDTNIEILNMLGQPLQRVQLPAQSTFCKIATADFAHGTYIVRVDAGQSAWSRKFVK